MSESASDLGPLLEAMAAAGDRFVVVVGPGLSDASAVPLPFVTNPTSPSLLELLRRELVSRGGDGLADRLLGAHDEDDLASAPARLALLLRSLASAPGVRDELVLAFERDKRPAATHRALAALALHGRLSRIVSTCYDHLLPWTFRRHRIYVSTGTTDAPPVWSRSDPKLLQLPLDVHLAPPLDAAASTLDEPLARVLAQAAGGGGVLVIGASGLVDGPVAALAALLRAGELPHGVFWLRDDDQHAQDAHRALEAAGPGKVHLLVRAETADLLLELAQASAVAPLGPVPPYAPGQALESLRELLDREIDVQSALELVPVVNLYEPVIERVPPIRVRTALVLMLLLAVAFAAWNAWEWRGREALVGAHRASLGELEEALAGSTSIERALEVARAADELAAAVAATELPEGEGSLAPVVDASRRSLSDVSDAVAAFRDERLVVERARRGIERALLFDERFNRFNHFPDPRAHELTRDGAARRAGATRPLADALAAERALLLTGQQELVLEVLLQRVALARLREPQGPLPVLVDLSAPGPTDLAARVRAAIARAAGLEVREVGATLIEGLLAEGGVHLLLIRPGDAAQVRRALFALERFREEWAEVACALAAPLLPPGAPLPAPAFAVEPLLAEDVLTFAGSVSPRLREALAARRDVLHVARDPLSLSIAVDHFLSGGRLPATRGLLLDAFVSEYLDQQARAGVALQASLAKRLLAALAEHGAHAERRGRLSREDAVRHLATLLDRDEGRAPPDPQVAGRLVHEAGGPGIDALAAAERALDALLVTGLLVDAGDGQVDFVTPELRAYACAVALRTSSSQWTELDSDEFPGALALYNQLQDDPWSVFAPGQAGELDPRSYGGYFVAAETLGGVAAPDPALEQQVLALGERLLGHATAFRRGQGARLLATLGTAPVSRAMLARVRSGSPRDAAHALDVLGEVGAEAAVPELLEVALDRAQDDPRRARAGALVARLGGLAERDALLAVVDDVGVTASVRTSIAQALIEVGVPAARERVLARLAGGDEALLGAGAALALPDSSDPRARAALGALARAPGTSPGRRDLAVARLPVADLVTLLSDANAGAAAARALDAAGPDARAQLREVVLAPALLARFDELDEALLEVAARDAEGVATLASLWSSATSARRARVVRALCRGGRVEALGALTGWLADGRFDAPSAARSALLQEVHGLRAHAGAQDVARRLLAIVGDGPERLAALAALARAWDPRVDPAPLVLALGVRGPGWHDLLGALGACRDPRVLDALVPIATDYSDPTSALLALAALRDGADLVCLGALQRPSEALTGDGPPGLEPAERRALAIATAAIVRACLARTPQIDGRVAAGLLERWGPAYWASSLWWWLEESGDDEAGTAAGEALQALTGDWVVGKE